jgi:hypothetical protein
MTSEQRARVKAILEKHQEFVTRALALQEKLAYLIERK